MKPMDNAKVIQTMEKQSLQKYLEKLINTRMHKTTLFTVFPYTGAPNYSNPVHFMIIDDLSKIVRMNSGVYNN